MENEIDEKLWQIAKQRASFKKSLFIYIVVNIMLWVIWVINKDANVVTSSNYSRVPWPVYPTLFWGIGVAINYYNAYHTVGDSLVNKEYKKLKNGVK